MGDIISASIGGIILGIIVFYNGFKYFKIKRLIENTPTSKIRSLAMGLVEIYGDALPADKPLRSPLSKTECVYYLTKIEEYRKQGKHSHWITRYTAKSQENFYVQDDTGKVLVNPALAEMALPADNVFRSSFGKDPSKEIMTFLQENKIRYEGFFGANKTMRYTETFIAPKDKLYVMGTATSNQNISATSKGHEKIVVGKGDKNSIFYVSDRSEKEVLQKFKWKIIGGIYGGIALTIGCLAILLMGLEII